jgi:hypothetical protein
MMKEKCSLVFISMFIKSMLIIGLIFWSNTSFSKQFHATRAHKLTTYNQKDPFGNNNDKTAVPLCLETAEDTDNDDDSVEPRLYTKASTSDISTAIAVSFNSNKPIRCTRNNSLPLYILFHAWRGFDC